MLGQLLWVRGGGSWEKAVVLILQLDTIIYYSAVSPASKSTFSSWSCCDSHSLMSWWSVTATLWGAARHREHTPSWVSSSQAGQWRVVKYWEMVPFLPTSSPPTLKEQDAFWLCTDDGGVNMSLSALGVEDKIQLGSHGETVSSGLSLLCLALFSAPPAEGGCAQSKRNLASVLTQTSRQVWWVSLSLNPQQAAWRRLSPRPLFSLHPNWLIEKTS